MFRIVSRILRIRNIRSLNAKQ